MVLIGAIVAAITSAITMFIPADKKDLARILGGLTFVGAGISAIGGLLASHESDVMQAKLFEKSEQIVELNREMLQTVTGGNAYPSFIYGPDLRHVDDPNVLAISLVIKGNKMIYDALISQIDLTDTLNPDQFPSPQEFVNAFLAKTTVLAGGTFFPNRVILIGSVRMDPQWDERIYRIETMARNGTFRQVTTLKRDNSGRWIMVNRELAKEKDQGKEYEILHDN